MPECPEESVEAAMRQLANHLAEEPAPSAASMWWRITLRLRRERARRAEQPLIWMTRISCAVGALTATLLAASIPLPSHRATEIGLLALSAVILPVALTLWGWSRSKI
jgi:Na+/proline symporter